MRVWESSRSPNEERSLGAAARGRTHVSSDCSWHAGHSPAGHFGDRAAGQISDFGSGAAVAVGDLGLVVQVEDLEVRDLGQDGMSVLLAPACSSCCSHRNHCCTTM